MERGGKVRNFSNYVQIGSTSFEVIARLHQGMPCLRQSGIPSGRLNRLCNKELIVALVRGNLSVGDKLQPCLLEQIPHIMLREPIAHDMVLERLWNTFSFHREVVDDDERSSWLDKVCKLFGDLLGEFEMVVRRGAL